MKKIHYLLILIGISIILMGCSNEKEIIESPSEPIIHSPLIVKYNDQEFEIINYYQEYIDFLNVAKKNPTNLEALFKQSFDKALKLDGFGYDATNSLHLTAPSDIEAMKQSVDILIEKNGLTNNLIVEALKEASDILPGGNKSVYIFPVDTEFMKEEARAGYTLNKNSIILYIDPLIDEKDLQHTVAHEYHHAVYMGTDKAKWHTLLEQSVLEGKAEAFAKMLFPNVDYSYLDQNQVGNKTWKVFRENINSTDDSITYDFYYGNQMKGITPYAKYKIGYLIVDSFLEENPNLSINEWTELPAEYIFMNSKYK